MNRTETDIAGRVQKDCLISYAGNQYSVPAEYSRSLCTGYRIRENTWLSIRSTTEGSH